MAKGESIGVIGACPCCGAPLAAYESKTGGITASCPKGLTVWAKYPACVTALRAKIEAAKPAPTKPKEKEPAKRGFLQKVLADE